MQQTKLIWPKKTKHFAIIPSYKNTWQQLTVTWNAVYNKSLYRKCLSHGLLIFQKLPENSFKFPALFVLLCLGSSWLAGVKWRFHVTNGVTCAAVRTLRSLKPAQPLVLYSFMSNNKQQLSSPPAPPPPPHSHGSTLAPPSALDFPSAWWRLPQCNHILQKSQSLNNFFFIMMTFLLQNNTKFKINLQKINFRKKKQKKKTVAGTVTGPLRHTQTQARTHTHRLTRTHIHTTLL